MIVRLRHLEMTLQGLAGFPRPRPELEQYPTPAPLAARLLFLARSQGDLVGRTVLDLGAGTGVLGCGAALLGAARVTGVEIDPGALTVARENAARLGIEVEWTEADVSEFPPPIRDEVFDTVVMNPPFGAQVRHADRPFIDAALAHGRIVYGVFNEGTLPFLAGYIGERGECTDAFVATIVLPRTMRHHTRDRVEIPVECVRIRSLVA